MVARDDLSGWVEARPLANATATAVAKFLFQDILTRHGCPSVFVMDGGPENKAVTEELAKKYKICCVVV